MNPFLILGVPPSAQDAQIRQAYLEGVRRHPPERDPVQFQAISFAYQKLATEQNRLEYQLFDTEAPADTPRESLARFCALSPTPPPLDLESMKTFLRECANP